MIAQVLPGCAAGGPGRSSACACSRWRPFLSWPGRWRGRGGSRPLAKMPRGPRCWCPSPSSLQWPLGRSGGLGCHDPVDGICRPGSGEPSRSRGRRSRWSRSLRPAMVPPARPYPLIAPWRELRVLALLAAANGAGVCAVDTQGPAGNSGLVRRPGGPCGLSWEAWADVTGTGDGGHRRWRWSGGMLAGMDDNGVITVRDLRRRYGGTGGRGFDAVRGVTFSVRRGELFALLGTNGAGKTSVMEVLEGLAPPAQGAVRVLGCDPCRERALVRRRMGIMLQEGGFPPDLTVAETGRMWAGTLSAPRPVAEALGLVSLGHRAGVAVRSLSGGERRRLDLAMAILGRPEVLFLDEPTTGLDPESRHRTWLLIRELLAAGTTVVLTTHYLE